jgi:oligosaccharyl transferase (archaeosortase A-associated)
MDREKRNELSKVLVIFLLGLVLRLYGGRNTFQGGNISFIGFDEFYHMRRILYTVNHFPDTIWFDSYLNYPFGMNLTWPPLFDQLIAGISLALGQHSQSGIEIVAAIIPVVIGSICVLAVYYMVREIFDQKVALMSALMTALAPYYLLKSLLGETDHHSLEVLLLIIAVMFMVLAISRKDRKDRRYHFAAASGVFMAGLAYTWFGATVYLAILLIYAIVQIALDFKNGVSSKETVTVILAAFGVALAAMLPFWNKSWLFPNFLGISAILVTVVVLYSISMLLVYKRVHWAAFPIVILVIGYIIAYLSHILNGFWIFSNVDSLLRFGEDYLFSGGMIGKISEAEPIYARPGIFFSDFIFSNLGWNLLLSLIGLTAISVSLWRNWSQNKEREGLLLLLVFALYTLILTIGQIRFLYLSSITMGILISILFYQVAEKVIRVTNRNAHAPLSKFIIPMLFLLLILPTVSESILISNAVPQISGDWRDSLNWLQKNSNTTSWYDNPDKTPEYSVLSWWDYGNWILYQAKRPVVVSNFQNETGIADVSKFFLTDNETTTSAILDARKCRYVITDYNLLYGKLPAIATWANQDPSEYQKNVEIGKFTSSTPTKKLMQTTLARLHLFDGSYLGCLRLIYESRSMSGLNPPANYQKIFEHVPGAVIRVTASPGQTAGVMLRMISNKGRSFQYVNKGAPKGDGYEIRVPYSTENKHDTHAVAPYLVFFGNSSGTISTKNISVSEEDVLEGRIIEMKM